MPKRRINTGTTMVFRGKAALAVAEALAGRPLEEPGMSRPQIIARARMAHSGKWPEQLTSGVMFYEGERITRDEFEHN